MHRIIYLATLLTALALLWAGCQKDPPKISVPNNSQQSTLNLSIAAGDGQVGLINSTLQNQLRVLVTDEQGAGLEGIPVYFGELGIYAISNHYGFASTSWTLGACGVQRLRVYAMQTNGNSSDTLYFSATMADEIINTFSTMTDTRDGESYAIATFRDHTWMLENLRYNETGSKLNPNNPSTKYGRLYTWDQAMVACPNGWHLPSVEEFDSLTNTITSCPPDLGIAAAYKSETGWQNNNGNNYAYFNAFPAGLYDYNSVEFRELGEKANFWLSNSSVATTANYSAITDLDLDDGYYFFGQNIRTKSKTEGLSCRCVKN